MFEVEELKFLVELSNFAFALKTKSLNNLLRLVSKFAS